MAVSTIREVVSGAEIDISNQENVSQRTDALRRNSKQQIRHRASVACYSCRDRRIRCVVPKGASECMQCKRSGTECVIKMDDERRRPISKAYVSSLSARIGLLEGMLEEKGVAIPPATHPPVTRHEAQCASSGDDFLSSASEARRRSKTDASLRSRHVLSPPYSHEDLAMSESPGEEFGITDGPQLGKEIFQRGHSPSRNSDLKEEDLLEHILFVDDGLSSDKSPRKPSSPSVNSYMPTGSLRRYSVRESPDQVRRAERILRSLSPKTHDYLMQNFWKHHNSVFQVVDRTAFEADRGSEIPRFYSSFLHIILLALGWRFADKDRCDVARINWGNHESAIHREAKQMLDADLERPTGIPSILSLLLLGDLECGVGRDNTGWMYAGMANRLAFEIGYDLSKAPIFTLQTHGQIACVPTGTETIEEEIHKGLFELMSLAGQVVDLGGGPSGSRIIGSVDESTLTSLLTLDEKLRAWYQRLPGHLSWEPDNTRTAPCSYFLLHEQYYAITILLHRSRGDHGQAATTGVTSVSPSSPNTPSEIECSSFGNCTRSSRRICTEAALQFSRIVSESKKRCDFGKICCTSLQPAMVASIALLAAIAQCDDDSDRQLYQSSLEVLTDIIRDMSRSDQPAGQAGNLTEMARRQLHLRIRNPHNASGNLWGQYGLFQSSAPMKIDTYGHFPSSYGCSTLSGHRISAQTPPSSSHSHYMNGGQLNVMSSLVPAFPDSPDSLVNLEPLYSMGVPGIYPSHGMPSTTYTSDNFLRLAPSAKGWGLQSLHAASHIQQPSANPRLSNAGLDRRVRDSAPRAESH
ncbi:hypothetical protein NPX13_g969 [Xylaria arbuscula]|uniref:Zn(2)-C6 fungal-type domain-containing protein n=1 Tax=Xylaria arbuscula TaxID=114810 RepID=A0A9W8NN02_9PEZI|nr:hypothetical protein NPX13_g969 [Xylaria arbuscula]